MTDTTTENVTVDDIVRVITETLGIEDRAAGMSASTPLFGSIPELDSLAVLELVASLEDAFAITVDDEEFSGELFETVGSLAAFVDEKRRGV